MLCKLTCFIILELLVVRTFALKLEESEANIAADEIPKPIGSIINNYIENGTNSEELNPNRIVNGMRISILNAPYQIALLVNGELQCGGSILNRRWILTAAHCVVNQWQSSISIRAGSNFFRSGGQLRIVRRIIVHGNYNENSNNNDIAMIKLTRPLKYNNAVQPIRLPSASNTPLPKELQVSGWGVLMENAYKPTKYLRQTTLRPISRSICNRNYNTQDVIITNKMLCMFKRGSDSCQGDSGGPLVAENVQYGIVSFGIGCARRALPGVYTDVRQFLRWIRQVSRNY